MSDAETAYGNLVGQPSLQSRLKLVEPCFPYASYAYSKLSGSHMFVGGVGSQMPPIGQLANADMLQVIFRWIEAGAKFTSESALSRALPCYNLYHVGSNQPPDSGAVAPPSIFFDDSSSDSFIAPSSRVTQPDFAPRPTTVQPPLWFPEDDSSSSIDNAFHQWVENILGSPPTAESPRVGSSQRQPDNLCQEFPVRQAFPHAEIVSG